MIMMINEMMKYEDNTAFSIAVIYNDTEYDLIDKEFNMYQECLKEIAGIKAREFIISKNDVNDTNRYIDITLDSNNAILEIDNNW